jgi:hypothetical protein
MEFDLTPHYYYESHVSHEITRIFHLSDIHIRNYERQSEYQEVFQRVYQLLHQKCTRHDIIVITGDLLHSKTNLSPEAIYLLNHFLLQLSHHAPVFMIAGNHDFNQANLERMDALSVVEPLRTGVQKKKNIYYLKYSGIYRYANIYLGVSSLIDGQFMPADQINGPGYKIALYHGPVDHPERFHGYWVVLLGDYHQYLEIVPGRIAYAGSLIQQNFGEPLEHGLLLWNLPVRKIHFLRIPNDYGFVTIQIDHGRMLPTEIPTKPYIRFKVSDTDATTFQKIYQKICRKYKPEIDPIIEYSENNHESINISDTHFDPLDELKKRVQKLSIRVQKIHQQILQKFIPEHTEVYGNIRSWRPLKLKFSNMFCYGENNVIDFRHIPSHQIVGIFAPNHSGKSAILDILLFCLFDRTTRGERRDVLNQNCNTLFCSLLLESGSSKYLIERRGHRNAHSVKIDVVFYQIKNGVRYSLTGLDKNETNRNIIRILGNYDDYLNTIFMLQNNGPNFIELTELQKKNYLLRILRLDIFEKFDRYVRGRIQKLRIILRTLSREHISEPLTPVKKLYLQKIKIQKQMDSVQELIRLIDLELLYLPKNAHSVGHIGHIGPTNPIKPKISVRQLFGPPITVHPSTYDPDHQPVQKPIIWWTKNLARIVQYDLFDVWSLEQYKYDLKKFSQHVRKTLQKLGPVKDPLADDARKLQLDWLHNYQKQRFKYVPYPADIPSVTVLDREYHFFYEKRLLESLNYLSVQEKKIMDQLLKKARLQKLYMMNNWLFKRYQNHREHLLKIKNSLTAQLENFRNMLNQINYELGRSELHRAAQKRMHKKIEHLLHLKEAYETYAHLVDMNGLPRELLNNFIPELEMRINQLLRIITEFQIFLKTKEGRIQIYMSYPHSQSYHIDLASGFEKFMINLMFRIVLSETSLLPKPNMMIIDEGWSCLDQTHLARVHVMLSLLKEKFHTLIIITHLESLKVEADTVLTIERSSNMSYINYKK